MCILYTVLYIYVCYRYSTSGFLLGSPGVSSRHLGSLPSTPTVHLDFFGALQVSRPNTWAHFRVPHMQGVRVRKHTHTSHTHQPLVKNGETLPSHKRIPHAGNEHQPWTSWKTPASTPLLHMHAMVFETTVNSTKNTCWTFICEENMTTTKWIKIMTATTSTKTTARRNWCKRRWSCTFPLHSTASGHVRLPPILHFTTSFPPH